jgi:glucan phosphoethanolaminetransferase (alkaline phosphatase superfamily)
MAITRYKPQLLLAFSYFVMFEIAMLHFRSSYFHSYNFNFIIEVIRESTFTLLFLFVIFHGLSFNKILFRVTSVFLFITGAIGSYAVFFFKMPPSKQIIRTFFENEISESFEFIGMNLMIWISVSILVVVGILVKFRDVKQRYSILKVLCFGFFIYNIVTPQYRVLQSYFPISYLHGTYLYILERMQSHIRIDISQKFEFSGGEDVIGVLVIGESARYDHFGINGYTRNTTPKISAIPNLYSFQGRASSNLTYLSVPSMLTRTAADNTANRALETTFLSVFGGLGYQTSWVGTQSLLKYLKSYSSETIYDEVMMVILPGGSALYKMNDHDEVLLPYFENILLHGQKQFVVLHTFGSHWNYAARYPKEYEAFTPVLKNTTTKIDQPSCDHDELINSYDNSILYTDYILSEIISKLKDKNAFLIFASDHGESLGEGGIYAHGSHMNSEQLTIPFIFWVSDKFISTHHDIIDLLNKRKGSEVSHDYIFHSALDCAGIKSEVINPELSLCR